MSMFHSMLPLVSEKSPLGGHVDHVDRERRRSRARRRTACRSAMTESVAPLPRMATEAPWPVDAGRLLVDRPQLLGRQDADVGRPLPGAQVGHRAVPARAVEAEHGVDGQRHGRRRAPRVGVEGLAARLVAADRRLQQRLDLRDGAGGQDVVAGARDVLDAQAAAGQPGAHVLLGVRGDAEALRVLRGRDEVVIARARAIEDAAQERVLGVGPGVGEDEPDAQALGGRAAPVRSPWETARGTLATRTRSAAAAPPREQGQRAA